MQQQMDRGKQEQKLIEVPRKRKVCLKFIEDRRKRSEVYRNRKASLKKKAYELATLCDIPVLLVCDNRAGEGEVEAWPEDMAQVQEIYQEYRSCQEIYHEYPSCPAAANSARRNLTLNDFYKSEIRRQQTELPEIRRQQTELAQMARIPWDNQQIDDMSEEALSHLKQVIDSKLAAVRERIQQLSVEGSGDHANGANSDEMERIATEHDGNQTNCNQETNVVNPSIPPTDFQPPMAFGMPIILQYPYGAANPLFSGFVYPLATELPLPPLPPVSGVDQPFVPPSMGFAWNNSTASHTAVAFAPNGMLHYAADASRHDPTTSNDAKPLQMINMPYGYFVMEPQWVEN